MSDSIVLAGIISTYFVVSIFIFDYIYNASQIVIDEKFHLPLGLQYCHMNYTIWDNKITTLPGLYLYSSILTTPIAKCSIYALRYTIFVSALVNIAIMFKLRKHWMPNEKLAERALNVINILLTPPVYFFSFVYYTDILSMTLINAMVLFGVKRRPFISSILGFVAMVVRQNNAVYVLFAAGLVVLEDLYHILTKNTSKKRQKTSWDYKAMKSKLQELRKHFDILDFVELLINGACYAVALMAMALFVYLNGSIVVGDKEAHNATLHIPQIFYFTLFVMFFSWPHVLSHLRSFVGFVTKRIFAVAVLLAVISYVVHINTIVHPYLLADNRHYMFYVWNRFLATGKLRQLFVPIYLCGLYILWRFAFRTSDKRFSFVYALMLIIILTTQSLIDIRYFLTPYVILRTFMGPTRKLSLILEMCSHIVISAVTLYIFGHKEIMWMDFDEPQRLIW